MRRGANILVCARVRAARETIKMYLDGVRAFERVRDASTACATNNKHVGAICGGVGGSGVFAMPCRADRCMLGVSVCVRLFRARARKRSALMVSSDKYAY